MKVLVLLFSMGCWWRSPDFLQVIPSGDKSGDHSSHGFPEPFGMLLMDRIIPSSRDWQLSPGGLWPFTAPPEPDGVCMWPCVTKTSRLCVSVCCFLRGRISILLHPLTVTVDRTRLSGPFDSRLNPCTGMSRSNKGRWSIRLKWRLLPADWAWCFLRIALSCHSSYLL